MPRIEQSTIPLVEDILPGRSETPVLDTRAEPGALDTLTAGFVESNVVSSWYDRISSEGWTSPDAVPGFDPLDDVAGYEQHADRFIRAESPAEVQLIKGRIDRELVNRDVLHRAGGWGIAASVAGGAIDPITLASMVVPVAPALGGAARITRIAAGIGAQVVADSASEVLLHQNQELRTLQDSAINVGTGALLTGAFGALATRVPRAEFEGMRKAVAEEMNLARPVFADGGHKSAGAAATFTTTLADEGIARGGQTIAKVAKNTNPILRTLQSVSIEARRVAQRLVEIPFQLEKNRKGIASPISVESRVKAIVDTGRYGAATVLDAERKALKKTRGVGMGRGEFSEAVASAMRRGDKSEIAEVQRAAAKLRTIINTATKAAQDVGALPEELVTDFAESYFPRLYNVQKILDERSQFERVLRDHFIANPLEGKVLDEFEIEEAIQRTVENITGARHGEAKLSGNIVPSAGPLKGRVLSVPDTILEPWLVSDTEHVLTSFLRKIVPHTELTRTFGTADMREALNDITTNYRDLKLKAADDATRNALDRQLGATLNDITAMRDKVLGTFGAPADPGAFIVRAQRTLRGLNYLRLMGGMALSSIPDVGRVMTAYGLPRTAGAVVKFIASPTFRKLGLQDAKKFGTALEMAVETRGASFADVGEEFVGSRFDQGMRAVTNTFSRVSGMAPWNTMLKTVTSALSQDALLRAVRKGTTKFERAQLASAGIDASVLERIGRELKTHGVEEGGLVRAHTDAWTDRVAARALEDYVRRQADLLVLTKGVGDTPLFLSSELGKTLFQFRSFSFAGINRLLVGAGQGVAAGDVKTISGVAAMLSLGILTYAVKEKAAGRKVETDTSRLVAEAIDKSGFLTIGADIWDPLAYAANVPFRFSRFGDRAPLESFLGPSYGSLGDLLGTAHKLSDGDLEQSDIHSIRKLLPFQNLWYLRQALDGAEGQLGEALGAAP